MKFLLDTNFMIHLLNGDAGATAFIRHHPKPSLYVCHTVQCELYYGAYLSKKINEQMQRLKVILGDLGKLDSNIETAMEYGRIKSELKKSGKLIGPNDLFIAATARAHQATLVTRNLGEFQRIENLRVIGY